MGKWTTTKRKASCATDDFDLLNAGSIVQEKLTEKLNVSDTILSTSEDSMPLPPPKKKVSYKGVAEESLKELRDAIEHCRKLNTGVRPTIEDGHALEDVVPPLLKRRVVSLHSLLDSVTHKTPEL
jgi:hypothetical protein